MIGAENMPINIFLSSIAAGVYLSIAGLPFRTYNSAIRKEKAVNVMSEIQEKKAERLKEQMKFLIEVDQVKNIFRQTYLADGKRKENDAEHSWHLALMAVLLKEHMDETADLLKVILMVLIHDLVEIDAGDTYAYDEEGADTKREREEKGAQRIFGILPEDQGKYFLRLWEEFEEYSTPEAKFAHLLDNFQPLLLNDASGGKSWVEHGVYKEQVYRRNEKIAETSETVWNAMQKIIETNVKKGNLKESVECVKVQIPEVK